MAATKVLVVDDDLNIQRVLVFTLKQEGFEVLVASDGEAGVELARTGEPELILMDVAMPKLDGRRTSVSASRACGPAPTTTLSSPSTPWS